MKKKVRKRGKKAREEISYWIEISDFHLSYSFSLSLKNDFFPGPFWEHSVIKMAGELIERKELKDRAIEVTILGCRDLVRALAEPQNYRNEPIAVGNLNL